MWQGEDRVCRVVGIVILLEGLDVCVQFYMDIVHKVHIRKVKCPYDLVTCTFAPEVSDRQDTLSLPYKMSSLANLCP